MGRPRVQKRGSAGGAVDVAAEILAAAGGLFGRNGVDATTMAEVAEAAGLRQSSLYYYFRSKEALVAELVARANVVPLALLDHIERDVSPPPVRLYRFVRGDVISLCQLPFDINEVHRIAARDKERFSGYWAERAQLEARLAAIIREGSGDGTLRPVDSALHALTVLSNDEAVQNWYRVWNEHTRDPWDVGVTVADLTVGGLLAARQRLGSVRRQADRLDTRPNR